MIFLFINIIIFNFNYISMYQLDIEINQTTFVRVVVVSDVLVAIILHLLAVTTIASS